MKYPRTPHLPWSPGVSPDDERVVGVAHFVGRRVVVTEKLDGECTTIWRGGTYARSLDSGPHPSRSRVRALAGCLGYRLGDCRIVGENVAAVHSIHYARLPSHFLVFASYEGDTFHAWDETLAIVGQLGLRVVPVLYDGPWNEERVRACFTGRSMCSGEQEGYVVRVADAFETVAFGACVAKFVRAGHVQTDEHWLSRATEWNTFDEGGT